MGGKKTKPELKPQAQPVLRYHSSFLTIANDSLFDIISTYADYWNPKDFFERPRLFSHKIKAERSALILLKLNLNATECPIRIHIFYHDCTTSIFRINVKPYYGGAKVNIERSSRNLQFLVYKKQFVYSTMVCIVKDSLEDGIKTKITIHNIDQEIERLKELQKRIEDYLKKVPDTEVAIRKPFLDAHIIIVEGKRDEFHGHVLLQSEKFREARIRFECGYRNYNEVRKMIAGKAFSPGKLFTKTVEKFVRGVTDLIQKAVRLTFGQYV